MRRFLFLQGPHGPLFSRLGDALRSAGHDVHRINLCGGDRLDWTGPAIDYRGSARHWPEFSGTYVARHAITDVLLYGDCRPLHSVAHAVAKRQRISIWVFEEGYIRPDWITLELDGVNGYSKLGRDPEEYLIAAQSLPPFPQFPAIASNLRLRLRRSAFHILHTYLNSLRFPHYRSHRPTPGWLEATGWAWRLLGRRPAQARARLAIQALAGTSYFLFPLQLDSDYQIRLHSSFANVSDAIKTVVASFAARAGSDDQLVLKQHPLDNGLIPWRRIIARVALQHDVADRVVYLERGDIAKLVKGARGVVVVNSTTGTLALNNGVPTIALGQAVYDMPQITDQGHLDDFWIDPVPPNPVVWDAFRRVLRDRCLIRGSMLDDASLKELVAGAVDRLTAHTGLHADRLEAA
jgi:capsular polysaccharide export protein